MKFEQGLEKKERDDMKAKGEKLKGLDAYKDFNSECVDELLEKRRREGEEFNRRQKERIEKLEKMEDDGKLYIKNN